MEFNPHNPIVQRCLQGMAMEEKGKPEEAGILFLQAWNEAANDFEKFLSAHYVARHQQNVNDKLKWLETALQLALKINNDAVNGALPALYSNIAMCYEALGNSDRKKKIKHWQLHPKISQLTKALFITARKQICKLAIC